MHHYKLFLHRNYFLLTQQCMITFTKPFGHGKSKIEVVSIQKQCFIPTPLKNLLEPAMFCHLALWRGKEEGLKMWLII